jgi:hypothetical protein
LGRTFSVWVKDGTGLGRYLPLPSTAWYPAPWASQPRIMRFCREKVLGTLTSFFNPGVLAPDILPFLFRHAVEFIRPKWAIAKDHHAQDEIERRPTMQRLDTTVNAIFRLHQSILRAPRPLVPTAPLARDTASSVCHILFPSYCTQIPWDRTDNRENGNREKAGRLRCSSQLRPASAARLISWIQCLKLCFRCSGSIV